jgi:uncharacterized membrane protein YfcA
LEYCSTTVTLTSIGAGALGTVTIFLVPLLATPRLVGTEIAHAVPLTLVAGLGHASMGNLDLELLGQLLIGSLPGIYSMLSGKVPDLFLRNAIAIMLFFVGYGLVFLEKKKPFHIRNEMVFLFHLFSKLV